MRWNAVRTRPTRTSTSAPRSWPRARCSPARTWRTPRTRCRSAPNATRSPPRSTPASDRSTRSRASRAPASPRRRAAAARDPAARVRAVEPREVTEPKKGFRSGFVAVIGRPNTGKSTLVNALVGRKVAIVSDKPQTTRRGVRAVLSNDDYQVVFTDTPGFHKPQTLLGSRLNDFVGEATQGVDAVVQVVDAQAGVGRGDAFVFERQMRDIGGAKFCAVDKVDLLRNREEVPQLEAAAALGAWDEIVPVSAKTGRGVGVLLDLLVDRLPEGPAYYPTDTLTDQPLEVRLAEIVREKALTVTRQER